MTSTSRVLVGLTTAALTAGALLLGSAPNSVGAQPATAATGPLYVYRIHAPLGDAKTDLLASRFDLLETRDGDDLFVLGDNGTSRRLADAGLPSVIESVLNPPSWSPPRQRPSNEIVTAADIDETYYGGYRTVNAQYAHLDKVSNDHPDLASVVTYGQSWRKANGNARGYDLKAVCITKRSGSDCRQRTDSVKPRFFLMSQVHAREITTGEMSWRFIDHLVNGYGSDAEVTSLLDSTEVWVVPIGNPDGVDIVQQNGSSPLLQRKNANTSAGGCTAPNAGVDLNRNLGSHWGESGSTTSPCGETYRGVRADSEIENYSLESLWRKLFADRRDGAPTVPAPADTRGVLISMHSYADMVLFPWAYDSTVRTGNDGKLREMAREMAGLLGYRYGQPGEILYNASGSHDDWTYDQLGLASFTIEVGPQSGSCSGFLPSYSCQPAFWSKLRPALMYAAKKAASPYGGTTPPPTKFFQNTNDFAIADRSTVESPIPVAGLAGNAPAGLRVSVAVKHTYRGDLVIDLVAPDGTTYRVKSASGDSGDDINATYTVDASGETAGGTWKLRVYDAYNGDTGVLDSWSLQF